jgi:preprotein translocase subunit SecD
VAGLGAVPATPASADAAARPALLDGGDGAYAPRLLLGPAAATGDIADGATAVAATTGEWVVDLHLTASGAALFDQLAERYHHTLIGIDVNGVLLSTPVMLGTHFTTVAIERGGAGGFTEAEATDLAVTLGHPLPVRLQVVSVHAAQGA